MPKRRSKATTTTADVAWSRAEQFAAGAITVVLLFMDFSIRIRSAVNKTIDFQVMIKIAIWLIAAAWVAANYKKIIPLLNRVSIAWILLFGWMGVTALYSPAPLLTLTSGVSMILMVLLWLGAANTLGERKLVHVMFWAMVIFCAASMIYWLIDPNMAQKSVRLHGVRVFTNRLQGLTGQPNALGRTAAFAALLGVLYFDSFKRKISWFALIPIGIALVTLFVTQSRTSALAFMIAGIFFFSLRSGRRWAIPALAVAAALAALVIVPNFESLAMSVARTGDPTEIYTATNRIYIWHLVAWMIQQRPLIGWGYNTAAYHLAAYSKEVSPELGSYVPPNAHNAYLEVAFAGGIIALLLFLVAAAVNAWSLIKHRHQRGQALMIFWFVTSFTEVAGFTGVVSTSTVTMILPMALAALAESRMDTKRPRRRRVQARASGEGAAEAETELEPAMSAGSVAPMDLDSEPPPPPGAAKSKGAINIHDIG